ncbi:hypothetical protein HZH66_014653 [Vespula vulgaris]|uniref:Uncharacterized protein n=1 Tax=Vespula vulgaris TaxID=7454 RepID=A0A834MRI1_VESVU|nr:hypothetical protein HZH66_014653 [Vespula vulgaris]
MNNRHLAYFTTLSGVSLDVGAKELADTALPVKERISISTQLEKLDEALHSLLYVTLELQLETIGISRGPVGYLSHIISTTEIKLEENKKAVKEFPNFLGQPKILKS